MLHMINKMGEDGKKYERKQEELEGTPDDVKRKPLLPKFLANILIVICSVLSTMATLVVILVLVKYCKMSSIVASLVVGSQLPPPAPATLQLLGPVENMYITCQTLVTGFRSSGMTDGLLHKLSHGLGKAIVSCEKFMTFFNDLHYDSGLIPPLDPLKQVQKPTEMPKESCENQLFPWLSFLNILLATVMLGHSLYRLCRPLTWYYGYEFKRCSLYLFVYDGHNYTPIKVKTLRGHMNCYKIEDNRKDVILTLNKHWIFDTVSINWNGVQVLEEDEPIPLPTSVPILLRHKVKTRNILSQDYEIMYIYENKLYEIQYSIKQGTNWLNMTKHYRSTGKGFVKKTCKILK